MYTPRVGLSFVVVKETGLKRTSIGFGIHSTSNSFTVLIVLEQTIPQTVTLTEPIIVNGISTINQFRVIPSHFQKLPAY